MIDPRFAAEWLKAYIEDQQGKVPTALKEIAELLAARPEGRDIEGLRYRCARAAGLIPVDEKWEGSFEQLHHIVDRQISPGSRGAFFNHLFRLAAEYLDQQRAPQEGSTNK